MNTLRNFFGSVALAALASGCGTSPSGEGFTNGPSPSVLRAEEKSGIRDDLREPAAPPSGASRADSAASGTSSGPQSNHAEERSAAVHSSSDKSKEPKGTPPVKEATGENSAAGSTSPSGEIKVGTPRGPQ